MGSPSQEKRARRQIGCIVYFSYIGLMEQNKKAFRLAATEIAQRKGIPYKKARQILATALMYDQLSKEYQNAPKGETSGLWHNLFKENGIQNG